MTPRRYVSAATVLSAVLAVTVSTAAPVAAGPRTVQSSGAVVGWGDDTTGQLGNNSRTSRYLPVQSGMTSNVVDIQADATSLALTTTGAVYGWGRYPGNGTTENDVPAVVPGLESGVRGFAAGDAHDLAIRSDGTVVAWGYNGYGQIGDGTEGIDRLTPVPVSGLTNVTQVAAGEFYSMALRSDGSVWTWGDNDSDELGNGTRFTDDLTPRRVTGLSSGVVAISAGSADGYALNADGTVSAWGSDSYGNLGDGGNTDRITAAPVPGLTDVRSIEAGSLHVLAQHSDGSVVGWGANSNGDIGDGTTTNRSTPVAVTVLSCVPTQISAGDSYTLALCPDGSVEAWGYNSVGALGDGTTQSRVTAAPVQGLGSPALRVAAGRAYALAITTATLPPDPPRPGVSISDASAREGTSAAGGPLKPSTSLPFKIRLADTYFLPVDVVVSTHDASATSSGSARDFVSRTQRVSIPSGQRSAVFKVRVYPDAVAEPDETLTVTVTDPNNAVVTRGTATGTIRNDD